MSLLRRRRYGAGWHPWDTLVLEAWNVVYDDLVLLGLSEEDARAGADKVKVSHLDGGPYSWHVKAIAEGHPQAIADLLADPRPHYGYPVWGENPYS